ncbi:S41 family peptidase [Parasphingorhabdus sp.]|uniref:S41 family peptidase n=1 Tax=Parasphingorhabdus sp. TaxID=2709688 RepID=UPI0032649A1D
MKQRVSAIAFSLAISLAAPVYSAEQESPSQPESTENFDAQEAWQEFEDVFRLFYAYSDRSDMDVETLLERAKAFASQSTNREQFRKILHQTALTFSDPHFIVGPFDDTDYSIIPTGLDIATEYRDGQFYIADVRAGSAADKAGLRPGWKIISADGIPMAQAVTKPYGDLLPNPTPKQLNYGAMLAVSGLRNQARELVFSDDRTKRKLTLAPTYDYSKEVREGPLLEITRAGDTDNIGVIRINNALGNNDLIAAFDQAVENLSDTKAMIIDLRNTPSGGNTEVARSIIGHFVQETRAYQVHEIPSIEREFTVPRRFIEQVKPRNQQYKNPVIVLSGRWTGSMGEGLVIGLDAAADAYTIASDMGDLLGGLSNFTLEKSGARMDLGTETLFHVDGTPREDYIADMPLASSDRDANGNDPAMDKALQHLGQSNSAR